MVTGYDEAIAAYHDQVTFSSCNSAIGPFARFPVPLSRRRHHRDHRDLPRRAALRRPAAGLRPAQAHRPARAPDAADHAQAAQGERRVHAAAGRSPDRHLPCRPGSASSSASTPAPTPCWSSPTSSGCPRRTTRSSSRSSINSVEKYSRHLCIGQSISSSEWPKHVKDLQGGYMRHLTKIIQEKQNAIGYSIKLTSASMPTKNQSEDTADWYLFPDQVELVDVNIKQIEEVFEKLFIKKTKEIKCERLNGIWILVCCHFQRDQRCGMSIAFSRGSHVRNFNDVR